MPNPKAFLPHSGQLKIEIAAIAALGLAIACLTVCPAAADKIKHPIAVFSGLDKITGRIITFEVGTNETVQFGSLQITERVCYSRPPTEMPQTDTFVEVDNIDANNEYKRVFTGWMFAGSPSLHALDHPVYDVWLLRCKGDGPLIPSPPDDAQTEAPLQPQQPQQQQAAQPQTQDAVKPVPPKLKPLMPTDDQQAPSGGAPVDVAPPPGFAPPSDQNQRRGDQNRGSSRRRRRPRRGETGAAFRPQAVAQPSGAASTASASCPETRLPFGQAQKSAFCATASASMSR